MRFIGNKTRILDFIESVIDENNIKGRVFCDIFAGSGAVGDNFKDRFEIISNDYLYSLAIINKAKLNNKTRPKFTKFNKEFEKCPFVYLNEKEYKYNKKFFITKHYTELDDRMYFTEKNAIKIDGIRIEIENLYKNEKINKNEYDFLLASLIESVMSISNTTGTYEAFLKYWDNRALKDFSIEPLEINITKNISTKNNVFNEDSNHLVREISGDILYIDPPYTVTDYSHAYHLLETLAKYDYPELRGKTGRRVAPNHKSKYTRRNQALINLEDLIRQAKFEHIMISYSTQGLIPVDDLIDLTKKFAVNGEVKIHHIPYREYKNIRSSKKSKDLKEIIIYFKKDNSIIKSPLNYTGSKDSMIEIIQKQLPRTIGTFVDAMGGAFNVGANITAMKKTVYNEFLPHVYEIIKLIFESDKKDFISEIEGVINKYKLEKGNKDNYLKLRKDYNKNKSILMLFVLQMYCFQNQMRFNNNLDFNTPVGNSSYNETTRQRIINFKAKTKEIEFTNGSYGNIDIDKYEKDTLFYFDPPYFITSAAYNDGKRGFEGWDADKEVELLEFLQMINSKGYKFMLSNVIYHKNKTNNILLKWMQTHKFKMVEVNGIGAKNRRNEVIITNYDWRDA